MNFSKRCLLVGSCLLVVSSNLEAAAQPAFASLLARAGISKGICSVPSFGRGGLAIDIATRSEFLVHAFDADQQNVNEALSRATAARLLGRRMVVEHIADGPLPYADHLIDLIVVDGSGGIPGAEIARVVRPRGIALVRNNEALTSALRQAGFEVESASAEWKLARKPALDHAGEWPHWYHGPDNNPVSDDTVIRSPYLTQWLGAPYYHAMPVVTTAAAGRVFVASGHIAHHDREIPTLNTLVARNGYNGRVLWKRGLPAGYLVHRSAFVATERVFYMIDGNSILLIDPETGTERGRLRVPGVAGTFMWMAKVGETLYLLAGESDPPAEAMKVHSKGRGWGWGHVDKNYSPRGKHQIRWGFGSTIAALDLTERKLLWKHECPGIDSRGMAILGDRAFYYVPAKRLAGLDRHRGEILWLNEDGDKLRLVEHEARGLSGTPGFRTEAMLLATPVGLFIQGQKRMNVVAFSVEDGHFLWARRKYHNNPNMLYAGGRLFISGVAGNGAVQVLDPASGETLENLGFWKGSCTRMTASPEALYCRGEGLGRYDLEKTLYSAERTARPGCNDGAIAANGLLYVGPWLCDCNLSILGEMVLGPARGFGAHVQTLADKQLDRVASRPPAGQLAVDDRDWPVYRGNNQRGASCAAAVPSKVRLLWRSDPPTRGTLQAQPVTVGDFVYTAGEDGIVRCLDAAGGNEIWRFVTGGPILASPTIWDSRTFVGSGDGYVYCLEATTGRLLWRFRVAPVERRIMVYGRLASTWPVNSGVLVHDGRAFAAAGIIFRDGTHVVALDARSGELVWHNGTVGKPLNERFELRAASALGTLAIGRNRLWLASGNVVAPVSFDLTTGKAIVVPAERIPVWNTVMAQKPESAGRDVMIFADRILMHGGRLLYSGEGQVVSSAQINFRIVGAQGSFRGPAFTPARHCAVPPAWDDEVFVMPTSRYGDLISWSVSDVERRIAEAVDLMVKRDKKIPGDTPEKWGQYGLIGRAFTAVERQIRSTSKWPVIRDEVYATAVSQNALLLAGRDRASPPRSFVAAHRKTDGELLWKVVVPAEPRLSGLALHRRGSAIVALADGSIVCVGE